MSGPDTGYDLVVVTNWLPVRGDPPRWRGSSARMAWSLRRVVAGRGGAWVGGSARLAPGLVDGVWLHPVPLTARQIADHYHGHCLGTLAPLYVDACQPVAFDRRFRDAYREVNRRVAEGVAEVAGAGALVWVHDYHLQLVPSLLREARPDLRIGVFMHAPFPPVERFVWQPAREEILDGLLGADLIGFQQNRSAGNFVRVAAELRGLSHDGHAVGVDGRRVATRVLPASVDAGWIETVANSTAVRIRADAIRATVGDPARVLLSIGGADPADGVARRLDAYAQLLAEGRLDPLHTVLVHLTDSGEEDRAARQSDHQAIDRTVAQINGTFARLGHPAVHYLRRELAPADLVSVYLTADVLLATPLHQGMTLAAKEYAASRTDGSGRIVLSEFTGAAADLPEADIVNPHDMDALKAAIHAAARADRRPNPAMRAIRGRIRDHDVHAWADTYLTALSTAAQLNQPDLTAGIHR